MQTGTEDDGIEQVDGENSVNRRTFVQGVGMLPLSTSLLDNEEARQQLDLGNSAHGSGRTRRFTIHAIEVDIVYNRFGLHQPNGVMYVLDENLDAVREASGETPDDASRWSKTRQRARNSVAIRTKTTARSTPRSSSRWSFGRTKATRSRSGSSITLDRQASIHQTALPYNVQTSDGMAAVGLNPDTTAKPGNGPVPLGGHTYGHPLLYDGANQAVDSANEPPEEANLLSRGLFGAIAVEPPGATWSDPETGGELHSGTKAVIDDPNGLGTTYREFVPFYHTPEGIEPEVQWPSTGEEQTIHAINYRADPLGQRDDEFYNSWTNGDPGGGDNVFPAYKGDPIKYTFVGASLEENHVHHHQHRWKEEVPRTAADTIDSQTIGLGDTLDDAYLVAGHGPQTNRPGLSFSEAFEVGAGYNHGSAGDVLFHCHLFPITPKGCGLSCVYSTRCNRASSRWRTPADSSKGSDAPGYPELVADAIKEVEGVDDPIGHLAPKPPLSSVNNPREPTDGAKRSVTTSSPEHRTQIPAPTPSRNGFSNTPSR